MTVKSENVKKEDKYDCKKSDVMDNIAEFAKWVPMRLTDDERKLLHILEGALEVSQYTDKVDVSFDYYGWNTGSSGYYSSSSYKKQAIIDAEISKLLDLITGLCVAGDPRANAHIITQTLTENVPFFQRVFEIRQCFKINESQQDARTTYGKLIHMLQDCASSPAAAGAKPLPIRTVRRALEQHGEGALALLETLHCTMR